MTPQTLTVDFRIGTLSQICSYVLHFAHLHGAIMSSSIQFVLDGKLADLEFNHQAGLRPTTTVLNYLRSLPTHRGVKEGCAEGDCGACTVVLGELSGKRHIRYTSVDSCLMFLPMIHQKHLVTVENLKSSNGRLHPVQQAMVETDGSQCGYCTPGIIMSLFALYKNVDHPTRPEIDDALTGNLCRCTGYKPIVEAAAQSCVSGGLDEFTDDEHGVVDMLKSIPDGSLSLKTDRQEYFRPATLAEALSLKQQYPKATVICGATDVALRVTKKHELIPAIIDLSGIDELKTLSESEMGLKIGAGVTLSDLMSHLNGLTALRDMLSVFGSQQIRNLATLGGNLGTASPIGDLLPVFMAYGARVILQSTSSSREIQMDQYITGYRQTAGKQDELIVGVMVPKQRPRAIVKSYKVSKRKDLDISTVSGGFKVELSTQNHVALIMLAYGGMADRVQRAIAAEQFLLAKPWDRTTIEQAIPLIDADFTPLSDARGSAEFRRVAARNLLMKFWSETASPPNS